MDGFVDWVKVAAGVAGGALAYVFGPWDALIAGLVCAAAIDYATGLIKAAAKKSLDSRTGFLGLLKKAFMFGVVGLAAVVDRLVPAANEAIRAAVIIFYTANEGISILENAGEMGLPMPAVLKNMLIRLRDRDGAGKSDDGQS